MTRPAKRYGQVAESVPTEGFTRISVVRQLPDVLREFGVDPGEALEAAGVRADIFEDLQNTIEYRQFQQLLATCERLTHCDYITMLIAQHTRLADYGIVGQSALCAATAGEGLHNTSAGVKGEDRGFPSRGWRIGLILWTYLFLFQGPVYYHLLVMVILILWGYDRLRPWKTLAFVLVASAWAGISRVNWQPVPGLLAATLYLLECKIMPKATWRYLVPPVLWTALGTTVAFVAQQAYMTWSGNPPEQFGSSFTSDLLWYRLLPSHTYPLGILPSILLVSLPALCLIAVRLLPRWRGTLKNWYKNYTKNNTG